LILVGVVAVVAVVAVALSGVGSDATPTQSAAASTRGSVQASPAGPPALLWPAPTDPLGRTVEAGLEPAPKEFLANHAHAHLDVFIDGKEILVPAGIGINIEDPEVRKFDNPIAYGGIEMCDQPCISPLHTHDETGILHTESSDPEPNTLGQFFTEWASSSAKPASRSTVRRRRSRCTSAVSSPRGILGRSSSPTRR
jgi:hypothetical protein